MSSLSAGETETTEAPAYAQSAAGFAHSAQIDYDGSLYLWGDNTYGQSSAGTELYVDEPLIVDIPSKPIQVSLGAWHTMVLTENGDIYTCGRNTFGQLGSQSWENSNKLVKVEGYHQLLKSPPAATTHLHLQRMVVSGVGGINTYGQLAGAESEDLVIMVRQ
jgi:alpha-tubulin suppressor-like RCC1 family protein